MEKITNNSANLLALPLEVRAQMAFDAAFEKVLDQHARLGLPMSIWRDGRLVEIAAEEIQKESANGE